MICSVFECGVPASGPLREWNHPHTKLMKNLRTKTVPPYKSIEQSLQQQTEAQHCPIDTKGAMVGDLVVLNNGCTSDLPFESRWRSIWNACTSMLLMLLIRKCVDSLLTQNSICFASFCCSIAQFATTNH